MKKIIVTLILLYFKISFAQFPYMGSQQAINAFDSSDIMADIIIKSKIPVLVDFWASWCGPCRILSPTIEELSKKYAGKIKVLKINVDVHRRIAAYFRVSAIPAIFLVKDKTVVNYLPGLQPKDEYEKAIKAVISQKSIPADTSQKKKTDNITSKKSSETQQNK